MRRFRDIIAGTTLWSRLDFIVDEAKNNWLRDLGKNDFQHSKSIELVLDRLVPDDIKANESLFDHGEIFILLASVYLHDIGRKQANEHHQIESYEQIRNDPSRFYLRDSFEGHAVAQVCAAHADESIWPISRCDPNYGIAGLTSSGRTFNLQRLGALLRIADELDNAYVRVRGTSAEDRSTRRLIRDINPQPKKGIVEIQAEPQSWKDWDLLSGVREYTQNRLKEVRPYLKELGLDYYQIWLQPAQFKGLLSLPQPIGTYEDLIESAALMLESKYTSVELFTTIGGCRVSILCTDNIFGIVTHTAVLVTPELDESRAHEFVGALSYLQKERLIIAGLVVVNVKPEDQLASIITGRGFHLRSLNDLLVGSHDFGPAMDRYMREYEQKEIFQRGVFVSPEASLESGQSVGEVLLCVESWSKSSQGVQLTILGDYGSGKTTLCERILYEHAEAYKHSPESRRIPVLLSLKEIGEIGSIEAVITNLLVNKLGIEISYKTFEALNKAGRFLLILDGFDEMGGLMDERSVLAAFRLIDSLVEQRSKVILTCRTHFFKDTLQVHALHEGSPLYKSIDGKYGYELLFLNPFTPQQVNQYIEKWSPNESESYKTLLSDVYNLADLATRPVLLNMIVKTIPQLDPKRTTTINAASLYEMYIRFWLERDDWRSLFDVYQRRALAESMSNFMFLTDRHTLHYSEIPALLKKWLKGERHYNLEVLDYELRTCNFLKRDHAGNYTFVHVSFMEYLLAYLLCHQLFESPQDVSVHWFLPLETDEQKKKGTIRIASEEVQSFVCQIAELKMAKLTHASLINLIGMRKRAAEICSRFIHRLGLPAFDRFYATLLTNPKYDVNRKAIAQMILPSERAKDIIASVTSIVKSSGDICHLWQVLDLLKDSASKSQRALLEDLEAAIDEREAVLWKRESRRAKVPEYPYTRARRNEKLDEVLLALTDADEVYEARKKFYRNWYREKHEYDQAVRKRMRLEKQKVFKDFTLHSKRKDRDNRKGR